MHNAKTYPGFKAASETAAFMAGCEINFLPERGKNNADWVDGSVFNVRRHGLRAEFDFGKDISRQDFVIGVNIARTVLRLAGLRNFDTVV